MRTPAFASALLGAAHAFLLLAASSTNTHAQATVQGFQVTLENDRFVNHGTDRWFTNAVQLSWLVESPTQAEAPFSRATLDLGDYVLGDPVAESAGGKRSVVWTLGQNIYTPREIARATPQRGDRPWAGWLYIGATVRGFKGKHYQQSDIKLGCIGPCSQAGQVQRWVHKGLDATYPAGWEQQLRTRGAVQLSHMQLWRSGDAQGKQDQDDRFGFHYGFAVNAGSLRNYGTLMAGMVFGSLQGNNPVFALANEGDLVIQNFADTDALKRWLLFANISGTVVESNRLITGRTPYGRSEIGLRRWVAAWQWGFSAPLDRWFSGTQLVFSQTSRSSEFDSPLLSRKEGTQRWGSITLKRAW
jgi:lipid A 3-O-deacylase